MTSRGELRRRVAELERRADALPARVWPLRASDQRIRAGRAERADWADLHHWWLQNCDGHSDLFTMIQDNAVRRLYSRWACDPAFTISDPYDLVAEVLSYPPDEEPPPALYEVLTILASAVPFVRGKPTPAWVPCALANVFEVWLEEEGEQALRLHTVSRTKAWVADQAERYARDTAHALETLPSRSSGQFRTDPDTGRITAEGKGHRYRPVDPQVSRDPMPGGYPREPHPFPYRPDPFRVLAETSL